MTSATARRGQTWRAWSVYYILMTDSDDDGNWLTDAVSDGVETVRETTRSFLGVERERYVCPECNVACEESRTFDHRRAAFDGGDSPAWTCPSCNRDFVREADDSQHALDLYGRSPPE